MDIDKIFQSKEFRWALLILLCIIVLLFVLKLGIIIGSARADFSFKWGENYHRNFAGPRGGFMQEFPGRDKEFMDSYGVFGKIIKIEDKAIIINDKDEVEKIILVDEKTIINFQRDNIKFSDLKVDDMVVVIGEPDSNGRIKAKLIRILPPMSFNKDVRKFNNF